MKKCELCKVVARTFCESDEASLCWDCDAKVHGANFLVARHTRTLLCHACHSLTPWKASGATLGNAVSLCDRCAGGTTEQGEESQGGNDDDVYADGEDDDNDYDYDTEDEVTADEDGDNQVVPWSSEPPPPAPSSSSSQESVSRCNNLDEDVSTTFKRRRDDNDFQGSNSNNWGCEPSEGERGSWVVRVRRRTAVEGDDVEVEQRSAGATCPYGCDEDRASEGTRGISAV